MTEWINWDNEESFRAELMRQKRDASFLEREMISVLKERYLEGRDLSLEEYSNFIELRKSGLDAIARREHLGGNCFELIDVIDNLLTLWKQPPVWRLTPSDRRFLHQLKIDTR